MTSGLDIGRIVRVRLLDMRGEIVERPAIAVRKWSDEVANVLVFADAGDFLGTAPVYVSSCTHGFGERQWHWFDEAEPHKPPEAGDAGETSLPAEEAPATG